MTPEMKEAIAQARAKQEAEAEQAVKQPKFVYEVFDVDGNKHFWESEDLTQKQNQISNVSIFGSAMFLNCTNGHLLNVRFVVSILNTWVKVEEAEEETEEAVENDEEVNVAEEADADEEQV